jgi:hypothetical protein
VPEDPVELLATEIPVVDVPVLTDVFEPSQTTGFDELVPPLPVLLCEVL